jgi:hypothetical protein
VLSTEVHVRFGRKEKNRKEKEKRKKINISY